MHLHNIFKQHKLSSDIPYVLLLTIVFLVIVVANFPIHEQWFTGWDNLHPEFNFLLNFKQAFEGVWQANEGLGLVGGHGYAATLPHTIFLWMLSFVIPIHVLRAVFTFLMLLVGSIGTYYVTKHLLFTITKRESSPVVQLSALFSALFAMLNLGTVQNFYIQLEAFIIHFAFIPWHILTLWNYLSRPSKKTFLWFLVITIALVPAGFIPPLFIVQNLLIGVILLFYLFHTFSLSKLRHVIVVILTIICINAYWLLPFGYYTITHSGNYLNAYNNIQSTTDFIAKNQRHGILSDVALMRSFLFESNDITTDGQLIPILQPWITHLKQPVVMLFGYIMFILSCVGVVYLIIRKPYHLAQKSMIVIYIFPFLLLSTNIRPFSYITGWLQSISPLFEQAFRVAFTKFSIAYAFGMAVCSGVGLFFLLRYIKQKAIKIFVACLLCIACVYYAFPAFTGNFLYSRSRTLIPQTYFDLFQFMSTQPKNGRIMNIPQGWNWGWTIYSWGYSGSGFLWYGVEQPIMDRAFDVWSPYNENYYWELIHAIYAKNWQQFDGLLEKYHIQWIGFDPTMLVYPNGKWRFYNDDLKDHLKTNPQIELIKQFGSLILYKNHLTNKPTNDILLYQTLPNVLPTYKWNDNDSAIETSGPYISTPSLLTNFYYPFRSLFTNRTIIDREFSITQGVAGYELSPKLPYPGGAYQADHDTFVPVQITVDLIQNNSITVMFEYIFPETIMSLTEKKQPISWHTVVPAKISTLTLNAGNEIISIYRDGQYVYNKTTLPVSSGSDNTFSLYANGKQIAQHTITPPTVINEFKGKVFIPLMNGQLTYDSFSDPNFLHQEEMPEFNNTDSERYFDIVLANLPHKQGYLVEIQSKHVSGKALQFAVVNKMAQKTDFELPLPTNLSFQTTYLVIPPGQPDGLGYGLHFSNISTTQYPSVNRLRSVKVTPLPYTYLTSLHTQQTTEPTQQKPIEIRKTINTFSYLYTVTIPPTTSPTTLVLSQSFDPGWIAFQNGKFLPNHVLVNNWANGWTVKDSGTIYLFFWPQLLQWFGFLLIPVPFVFLFFRHHKNV